MARPSRAESQARTRDQLVATAQQMFLRDGYAATSLEKVADAAGYSKGAVYSNFRNKDELCLAALDRIHQERAEQIGQALTSSDSLDERLAAFQAWAEEAIGDQDWTALEVEFAIAARRDPGLTAALADRDKLIRGMLGELLETHAKELDLPLPMPAEDVATALLSLGIGLGVQRAIDPSIPVRVLTDVIRLFTRRADNPDPPGAASR